MVSADETNSEETTGSGRRLFRILAVLFAGIVLIAAAAMFLRDQDWAAAEHRDNYLALNIVGRSLESWPNSIETIARANLLPDRLEAPPLASERLQGWMAAARLDHPDIGTIHVLYKLEGGGENASGPVGKPGPATPLAAGIENRRNRTTPASPSVNRRGGRAEGELTGKPRAVGENCGASANQSVSVDPVYQTLNIAGRLRLADLWQADQELAMASSEIRQPLDYAPYVAAIDSDEKFFRGGKTNGRCPAFLYSASIPLTKIANIDTNAPAFSNILLIDPTGNVLVSLGDTTLPVSNEKDFMVTTPQYRELVTKLLEAASRGTADNSQDDEIRREVLQAERSAKPLDVDVAGKSYVAYFRPIEFEGGGGSASNCHPSHNAAAQIAPVANAAMTDTLDVPGTGCLLIGLVPQDELRARLFRLSPDLLTVFTILLAFALVLVPATKLRFLGPGGDVSSLEVGVTIFGLVAGIGIATIAALAMYDALRLHAQARASLEHVAEKMAGQFNKELQAAITLPLELPPVAWKDRIPLATPAVYKITDCRYSDNKREPLVNAVNVKLNDPPFWLIPKGPESNVRGPNPNFVWPGRELVIAFGELGRAFPGYSSLAYRCHAGARSIIDTRRYFQRAMRGETDGQLPDSCCSKLQGLAIDKSYSIGAVRAQLDGLAKIVLVNRFSMEQSGACPARECPGGLPMAPAEGGPRDGVVAQSFVPRSLLAPVMPRGMRFIVVDTTDRQLPYLFGTDAQQIGVYSLKETLPSTAARNAILDVAHRSQQDHEKGLPPRHFSATFEGMQQSFEAMALPGTPWVLLVYRPVSDVDVRIASRVGWAAGIWWSFALAEALAVLAASVAWKRKAWLWLWPRPGNGKVMAQAGNSILLICFVTLLALFADSSSVFVLAFGLVGVPIVSVFVAWLWLTGKTRTPKDNEAAVDIRNSAARKIVAKISWGWRRANKRLRKIMPNAWRTAHPIAIRTAAHSKGCVTLLRSDERGFARLGLGLLLALGTVPMCATWADSRVEEIAADRAYEIAHLEDAWTANRQVVAAIIRAYGLTNIPPEKFGGAGNEKHDNAEPLGGRWGLPDFWENASPTNVSQEIRTTTTLRQWLGAARKGLLRGCNATGAAPPLGYCVGANGTVGLFDDTRPSLGWVSWPGTIAYLLTFLGLVALLSSTCRGLNRALFGFGIPLEAVKYPGIKREVIRAGPSDENPSPVTPGVEKPTERKVLLPDRAVVLNGPLALMIDLLGNDDPLDLAKTDATGGPNDRQLTKHLIRLEGNQTVVVINLDIALKDPALRRQALTALEALSDVVERKWRSKNRNDVLGTEGHLVIMTDLSPLDRILQAYEREQDKTQKLDPSGTTISRTEQIRWSRLFEDFTTYTLPVQAKFLWSNEQKKELKTQLAGVDQDQINGVLELVKEVRFLPEAVIHSLISPNHIPDRKRWADKNINSYPLQPQDYHDIYFEPVCAWARLVRPATQTAAVDFLRGVLIEHYQHIWAASSHAERVILDNLARGKVINIEAALAIRSLIRRGLVVLDPAPRLINLSFAEFVRQAEKPQALHIWRSEQPKGGWDKIARPLAFVLPGAIVVLAVMAILAGESLTTVLPIVVGAGPALLSTLISGRKMA